MKARKMWTTPDWEWGCAAPLYRASPTCDGDKGTVPVLVTDARGMPDFEPGDRVRCRTVGYFGEPVRLDYEIAHIYFDGERWCFYSTEKTRHVLARFEKLPRETSVLLRVTGPEEDAEDTANLLLKRLAIPFNVRVERVEDTDER